MGEVDGRRKGSSQGHLDTIGGVTPTTDISSAAFASFEQGSHVACFLRQKFLFMLPEVVPCLFRSVDPISPQNTLFCLQLLPIRLFLVAPRTHCDERDAPSSGFHLQ